MAMLNSIDRLPKIGDAVKSVSDFDENGNCVDIAFESGKTLVVHVHRGYVKEPKDSIEKYKTGQIALDDDKGEMKMEDLICGDLTVKDDGRTGFSIINRMKAMKLVGFDVKSTVVLKDWLVDKAEVEEKNTEGTRLKDGAIGHLTITDDGSLGFSILNGDKKVTFFNAKGTTALRNWLCSKIELMKSGKQGKIGVALSPGTVGMLDDLFNDVSGMEVDKIIREHFRLRVVSDRARKAFAKAYGKFEKHGFQVDKVMLGKNDYNTLSRRLCHDFDFTTQKELAEKGCMGTLWSAHVWLVRGGTGAFLDDIGITLESAPDFGKSMHFHSVAAMLSEEAPTLDDIKKE